MNDPDVPAPVASPESDASPGLVALGNAVREAVQCLIDLFQPIAAEISQAFRGWIEAWNASVVQHHTHSRTWKRPRPRNTRIIAVQAKRKRLGLPQDGRLPGLSRKASYALMEHTCVEVIHTCG